MIGHVDHLPAVDVDVLARGHAVRDDARRLELDLPGADGTRLDVALAADQALDLEAREPAGIAPQLETRVIEAAELVLQAVARLRYLVYPGAWSGLSFRDGLAAAGLPIAAPILANGASVTFTVTLTAQLASIEEVDMAETISRLDATRTQLEASYQAISLVSELSAGAPPSLPAAPAPGPAPPRRRPRRS